MGNQKKEERNGLQTKRNFDASSVSRSFLFLPLSRKSCACQPIGGAVAVSKHPFDVGFTVEDFTA